MTPTGFSFTRIGAAIVIAGGWLPTVSGPANIASSVARAASTRFVGMSSIRRSEGTAATPYKSVTVILSS